jgi:hypothetical protein
MSDPKKVVATLLNSTNEKIELLAAFLKEHKLNIGDHEGGGMVRTNSMKLKRKTSRTPSRMRSRTLSRNLSRTFSKNMSNRSMGDPNLPQSSLDAVHIGDIICLTHADTMGIFVADSAGQTCGIQMQRSREVYVCSLRLYFWDQMNEWLLLLLFCLLRFW